MLQDLVGGVEGSRFEIEDALDKQLGARPLPFPGMDSECSRYFAMHSNVVASKLFSTQKTSRLFVNYS